MSVEFVNTIRILGNPIVYYPSLAKQLGDVKTTVFACYFIHASKDVSGNWIEAKQSYITEMTGLSRYEQEGARTRLKELGVMDTDRGGVPARLRYVFFWDKLDAFLSLKQEPKKSKAPPPLKFDPETTIRTPNLFFRIKQVWNEHYELLYPSYEWSKGKKGGADAGVITWFIDTFRKRVNKLKQKEQQTNDDFDVADDDIVAAFNMFMDNIPKKWKEKNFTLLQFRKYFNNIITDIVNEQKRKTGGHGSGPGGQSAGASGFVPD